ncbi:MAG: hypothetical protein HC893_15785, partial [Chloroflexaceae bacterium]|nr:hypothetical protein [Chloroflexaceae bacterium]
IQRTDTRGGLFVDYFAGSSVVARLAKLRGFRVFANDWEPYAAIINHCAITCNTMPAFAAFGGAGMVFRLLNSIAPQAGYITANLCPADDAHPDPDTERLFFTRANGMRIDALREQIAAWDAAGLLAADERAVLLGSMMYAVSYVSNTSGVFKGFHRGWGGQTSTALYRILSRFELRPPVFYDNQQANRAINLMPRPVAEQLRDRGQHVAIAYLDPPYNQHPYGSNYHVLNTVALWDKPPLPHAAQVAASLLSAPTGALPAVRLTTTPPPPPPMPPCSKRLRPTIF